MKVLKHSLGAQEGGEQNHWNRKKLYIYELEYIWSGSILVSLGFPNKRIVLESISFQS